MLTPDGTPNNILVVGIGTAEGGINVLRQFFSEVAVDSGIAYVVMLQQSFNYDIKLAILISEVSKIKVVNVIEAMPLSPDKVYVAGLNQHFVMHNGSIDIHESHSVEDRRAPIDIFFRMLAEAHGSNAVSIVLSGKGANGSMGLKRVKEMGGICYVQSPREAEYGEMPRNAIATGLVDAIMPIKEIPRQLTAYNESTRRPKILREADVNPEEQNAILKEIFKHIKLKTGHDFTNYKRPTLLRRIERRINIRNLPDLSSYVGILSQSPEEVQSLLKDLLISVTNFFRDRAPFEVIEREVLPAIFEGKNGRDKVRIWTAGCATGEEAYSLAILCAERLRSMSDAPKVQIFATDIDDAALDIARNGYYTINDAADVSEERLRKFFLKAQDEYVVTREIRDMVLFANHNFLKDPPFSSLDLVSCRNVFIYLNQTAQTRVLETFHFAMKPAAYLFMGTSESIDGSNELFTVFKREHHIFQSRDVDYRSYPVPESVPSFGTLTTLPPVRITEKAERTSERLTFGHLHQKLLEAYAPPSVVINEEYEVVHMSETVGEYFEFAGGEPTRNLLNIIRQSLRLELRSALYESINKQSAIDLENLKVDIGGTVRSLNILIRPVFNGTDTKGLVLIIFLEKDRGEKGSIPLRADDAVARQLEDEVIKLKSQLRTSLERHEFQSEELKASNEELQAMNEELRSAAEELETSKEELQSINEELRTVNQELKAKIEETTLTNNNFQNLINSSEMGTIFLDKNAQVKMFTPAVRKIFNLIPSDYGRPITDITNKLVYSGLAKDVEHVIETLTIVDRELKTVDNHHYMMRLLPYRTADDRIEGVVVTFFDMTKRRQAEDALRVSEDRFKTLTDTVSQIIWANDLSGQAVYFNQRWFEFSGLTSKESVGKGWQSIIHPFDAPMAAEQWQQAIEGGVVFDGEFRMRNTNGDYRWHIIHMVPLREEGQLSGWFASATDIERLKHQPKPGEVATAIP